MFDRSYHFIPANRPKLFDRTGSLGADAYVFDLEDAVSRDEKLEALVTLEAWVGKQEDLSKCFIRLNGCDDPLAVAERTFIEKYPGLGVVLPKVTSAAALVESVDYYRFESSRRIIGLIENAAGLKELDSILELNILLAVGLGLEDFLSHSIFETAQLDRLVDQIRSEIVLAAMARGVEAIDTISMDISGGDQLRSDICKARSAGFNGKFSIHPSQINFINEGFSPSEAMLSKVSSHAEYLNSINLESGYLKIAGEILSPPTLKKLQTIQQFSDHHEFTK
ncbi:MAG: HpcH/HpaI aldolase/citrate lyase family protein [Opitutaceae bacterium]